MIRRIVVGSDGSRHSRRAVSFAAELAQQLRAEVLLVHASGNVTPAQTTASHYLMDVAHYGLYESDASAASVEHLARTEWVRPLVTARVPWGVDVRYGWAADVLARCAEDIGAQLIIIGAGSHATQNGTEGSVVAVLSHRTPVPLLVVPDESPSIELRAAEHSAAAS